MIAVKLSKREHKNIFLHILIWVLYIVYACIITIIAVPEIKVIDVIIANLQSIWTFYSAFIFFKAAIGDRNVVKSIVFFLCSILGFYLLRAAIYLFFQKVLRRTDAPGIDSINTFLIDGFLIYSQFCLYSLGYYFAEKAVRREKDMRLLSESNIKLEVANKELILEKEILEKRRLQTESAFLRSQINPHFLQNTLNFLYSKTRQHSMELSEGVLLLSDIMRYSLEATKQQEDVTPVKEEIHHLKNLIQLQQLRFGNNLFIELKTEGGWEKATIPPLTLITLAENAFKYGELYDKNNPVKISLNYNDEKEKLFYQVWNKKKNGPVELSYGIGHDNVRNRLEMKYGQNFILETQNETDFYCVNLTVNI